MTLLEGYICSGYAQLILVFVLTGGLAYGEQEYAHLMDQTYHRMAFVFCCLLQLCVNLRFFYRAQSAIHYGAEKIGSFGKIDKFQVSTLRKHGVLLNKYGSIKKHCLLRYRYLMSYGSSNFKMDGHQKMTMHWDSADFQGNNFESYAFDESVREKRRLSGIELLGRMITKETDYEDAFSDCSYNNGDVEPSENSEQI